LKIGPRAKLLLLAALFFLPIAASLFTYFVLKPQGGTANYGELIPVRDAPAFAALRGKWLLIVADEGSCPAACRRKLEASSTARLALGRNASRVQRVFVAEQGTAAADLPRDGLRVMAGPTGLEASHLYLVDPNGNLMMRWPAQPDLKRMIKDLERLLKASQIG
jgi:hypothetical protein